MALNSMKKDFKCSCGCGQRLRIVLESKTLLDIGIMQGREKRPKIGVVLQGKDLKEFLKFIKI